MKNRKKHFHVFESPEFTEPPLEWWKETKLGAERLARRSLTDAKLRNQLGTAGLAVAGLTTKIDRWIADEPRLAAAVLAGFQLGLCSHLAAVGVDSTTHLFELARCGIKIRNRNPDILHHKYARRTVRQKCRESGRSVTSIVEELSRMPGKPYGSRRKLMTVCKGLADELKVVQA